MHTPERILTELGVVVRSARLLRRLSQEELSLRTGVHRNYIGGIERAERSPSVVAIARIAGALDVPLSELFKQAEARLDARPS